MELKNKMEKGRLAMPRILTRKDDGKRGNRGNGNRSSHNF